jgi:hypothetical protein
VLVYDTKARTWARHDVKDVPVPGHHVSVVHADSEFAFASHGWHRQVPEAEPSLHVFSARQQRWLRISAIPSGDALRLGCSEGLRVAMGWDYRPYAKQAHVPIGGQATPGLSLPRELLRRGDGTYLLRYGHPEKESSLTELVIRAADIQAAFEAASRAAPARARGPASQPATQPALNLDATVELLQKAVGGQWQKDLHSGLHISRRILRGEVRSGAGKVLVRYHVFPFGCDDGSWPHWQRWLQRSYAQVKGARVLGANARCSVVELTSDPAAAARYGQAVKKALGLSLREAASPAGRTK